MLRPCQAGAHRRRGRSTQRRRRPPTLRPRSSSRPASCWSSSSGTLPTTRLPTTRLPPSSSSSGESARAVELFVHAAGTTRSCALPPRQPSNTRPTVMKLLVSHPELARDLVCALNETDCVAARTGSHTLEVFTPWLLEGGDTAEAATELLF